MEWVLIKWINKVCVVPSEWMSETLNKKTRECSGDDNRCDVNWRRMLNWICFQFKLKWNCDEQEKVFAEWVGRKKKRREELWIQSTKILVIFTQQTLKLEHGTLKDNPWIINIIMIHNSITQMRRRMKKDTLITSKNLIQLIRLILRFPSSINFSGFLNQPLFLSLIHIFFWFQLQRTFLTGFFSFQVLLCVLRWCVLWGRSWMMRSKVKLCKFSVWKPFHSDLIQQQQQHTAAPRVRVNSLLLMCVVVLSYHLVFQIPLSLSVSRFSKLIIFNLITENVHLSSPLRFSTHSLSSSLHHRPYFLVQIDCSREIEC